MILEFFGFDPTQALTHSEEEAAGESTQPQAGSVAMHA